MRLRLSQYPATAQVVIDPRFGWGSLLTKDRRIRYRADELSALTDGDLFCLADGNAALDEITLRFLDAMPAIYRAVRRTKVGFWHVHADGRITRMWP